MNKQISILAATLTAACVAAGAQAAVYQAEDYNTYSDTTPANEGGAYRTDGVDIEATSDAGGGYNVGWIVQGEWLAYDNVSIPSTGEYTVSLRVASPDGSNASVDLNGGSTLLGNVAIPATGGWQSWQTVSFDTTINAGTHSLGVFAQGGDWNFNWIEITPAGGTQQQATLYQHCDYTGWSVPLPAGSYTLGDLNARGWTDNDMSSLQVAPGYEAVLYQNDNFSGNSTVVSSDDNCLVDQGFNDVVSSVVIRESGSGNDNVTWSEEFDTIDPNVWTFETGGGGWGNQELQYYTSGQNASIEYDAQAGSNVLVIEARQENPAGYSCWYGNCDYTSTRLISQNKQSFQYGRIEARMKLPQTQGIWPAFWMLGNSFGTAGWPQGGEIDIMEHVGYEPTLTHGALHGPGYSGNTPITGTNDVGEVVDQNYHVYGIEWDANGIRWYMDGQEFYSTTRAEVESHGTWVYDQPFWFLLNVAVGGTWPGSPDGTSSFPQRLYVDYIRVYQ